MTRPVRALLCGSVPPEWGGSTGGGVASFHRTLIEELLARGNEYGVEVAGLLPFNLDPAGRERPPVPVAVPPTDKSLAADFYVRTLEQIRPDVVVFQHIAHSWAVYHGRLGSAVPALGVVHSWNSVVRQPPDSASRVRRTIEQALRACDRLVFVSQRTLAEGIALGFDYPPDPVAVGNPFGTAYLEDLSVDVKEEEERRGWVFLGSFVEHKNPVAALEAAARCGSRLTLVGDGPLRDELRSVASRLGCESLVTFAGWAPPERVRDILRTCELLCNPSRRETFGIAYLEALACGVPVVGAAANVAELGERLGMVCGAGVTECTVDEVTAQARWVQASTWDRRELRRRTLAAFSPETVVSAYASIMRDLVRP